MYHKRSKRALLLRLITLYSIMTIAVIILVTILVFVTLGYQFNSASGTVEQGGLVQFGTTPSGASVSIDGHVTGIVTTGKTNELPGSHVIAMNEKGYQTWQKTVDVLPGEVLWLTYPRLVPTSLPVKAVASFPALSSTAASFDNNWYALQDDASQPIISLANLQNTPVKITKLTIPTEDYTAPTDQKTQTFTIMAWDPGNQYLLMKHTYLQDTTTQTEWLDVDTQNVTKTQNISTLLGLPASTMMFSGNNGQVLYALTGSDIREIDLGAKTISRPLVTNVAQFSLYNNTNLVYSTLPDPTTNARAVGYYTQGASEPKVVKTYPNDSQPIMIAIGDYYYQTYITTAHGAQVDVSVLKNGLPASDSSSIPELQSVGSMLLSAPIQYLDFQGSGRFVTAQSDGTYAVFDLELNKLTTTSLAGTAPVTSELDWLDDYHLWSDRSGTLRMYEFDGANQSNIMSVVPGFSATLNSNGTYMYAIGKDKDGTDQLQYVRMIL